MTNQPPTVQKIIEDYLSGSLTEAEYGEAILDEIHRRQNNLAPSFTYGLYGDGNKKRGLLHRFLAALGIREL